MKKVIILFSVFLFTFALHTAEYEEEQFLPDDPGMSEFFIVSADGEKIVTRIDLSINSLWTPTSEQIASAKPIYIGDSWKTGFKRLVVGYIDKEYAPGATLHLIGLLHDPFPSWTKNGNLWVRVKKDLYVDLDTAIVNQIGKHIFWEKLIPLREIPRTW